ncbi:MAG: hypothetical protein ABWX74_18755, partial [Aeromicrobium sp.]
DDLVADAVRAGVEIVLGTTLTQDSPDVATFDDVIVATGSSYDVVASPASRPDRRPEIAPDADVVGLDGAVADLDRLGREVVIADDLGDHAALSLALELAGTGRQVTLVTPGPVVGPVAAATGDLAWMLPRLAEAGVVLETGTWPVRMRRGTVTVGGPSGERDIRADSLVVNAARTADPIVWAPATPGQVVHRIGDCVTPRWVDDALVDAVRLTRTL